MELEQIEQLADFWVCKFSKKERLDLIETLKGKSSQGNLKQFIQEKFQICFEDLENYYGFTILLWNRLMEFKDLEDILSLQEAAQMWDLDDSTLRKAIANGKFEPNEYRKTGRNYIVKLSAMKRAYGDKT